MKFVCLFFLCAVVAVAVAKSVANQTVNERKDPIPRFPRMKCELPLEKDEVESGQHGQKSEGKVRLDSPAEGLPDLADMPQLNSTNVEEVRGFLTKLLKGARAALQLISGAGAVVGV